mmetsp:Transcript_39447/g.75585  ORF Transcript_39447/g.75585 Transcript_39447/m.75585 type:complete len:224 (-) Transcript_39447:145-816(-)
MQVRELLGNKCTPQMRQPGYETQWGPGGRTRTGVKHVPRQCYVLEKDLSMAKALLREFDVVGATDRYEEFLLMLSDKVGIRHLQYKMSNTGSHEKRRDKLHEDTLRAVTNSTAADDEVYKMVLEVQQSQIDTASRSFGDRLRQMQESTVKQGAVKFIGGKPPASLYKWVDVAEAERAGIQRVTPEFFTEPTGGGQATAYIYFHPVMLVPHQGGPKCIKGCTFD